MKLGIPLTKQTNDHSNRKNFLFSFFCDCCKKEWKSPPRQFLSGGLTFIEHEETETLIWAWEHQIAFEQANLEAHFHFNYCPECNRWVCDECFCTDGKDCRKCSEKKGKAGESTLEKT
ncbi:MAG: hypothetical protein FWF38_02685 [Spirochaetaceae bacterium]|nr:hypothetical protein [Spirochaetaceae bacterium]